MEAEKVQQTPPDPNSITQRKGAFIKAAHQYGQLYEWRKAQDQRFTEKRFRLGPVHTNGAEMLSSRHGDYRSSTNALHRSFPFSEATSNCRTCKYSTRSCMSPSRAVSGGGCRPDSAIGIPSTHE